ncbi:MAG: hypothetical protein HS126_12035 [Anaerolineales bacterium]|nr:hypothetical protein [Anaerolineales bacterium]
MTKRKNYANLFMIRLFVLLILAASPGLVVHAQDPSPSPVATPPSFDPRFGIVDTFVNPAEANAAGAGWTRVFFRWDVIQPAGPSDWKPANVPDPLLDAEIAAGREVVAVLIGTPAWATESGTSTALPPLEYWGEFVYKIASQYKGRIKHWVIWNQPDVTDPASPSHTWDGTAEDYYRLLKEGYLKIKSVDPAMQVHLAGLTYTWDSDRGNPPYLSRLLDLIVADPEAAANNYFFDAVSYHLYYNPRRILEILTDVRSILDAHGLGSKPIWINETNAPPSEDSLEPLSGPAGISVTLSEQSAFVIQAFAMALAGGAERIAFNKMRNDYPHPEAVEPYGLLRADDSRRPAFAAFQVVSTHFAGVSKTSWLQLGDVYIVTLDRAGQTTTVLWNTAATPTMFSLNTIAPQAILIDDQGNQQSIAAENGLYSIELPGAPCSNGLQTCFIGGSPRLIVENGSPDQRIIQIPLAATPTPVAVETSMPAPEAQIPAQVDTPPPPPTLTPTPTAEILTALAAEEPSLAAQNSDGPLIAAALPDPGLGDNEPAESVASNSAAPTAIPPVTIATILRPERIFWLFIIGLIVFTVSYGVQVVIWYRLRR